jgi:large subunit ribosomal protein L24e
MTVDSTLTFAARRNVPIRYNRDLVQTTLKAMDRVTEIRQKRERAFYRGRMAGNKARTLEDDRKLVAEHQHLLPPSERYIQPDADDNEDADTMAMDFEDMESDVESDIESDMELDEEEEEALAAKMKSLTSKSTSKQKRKMLVGGGTA